MTGDSTVIHKRFGINARILIAILGVSIAHQESSAFLGLDLDTLMFNLSLRTAKYSLRLALKSLINSPKMVAVILSIYFHKEILGIAKDTGGYVVGEFPEISFVVGLCALFYASTYFAPEEEVSS